MLITKFNLLNQRDTKLLIIKTLTQHKPRILQCAHPVSLSRWLDGWVRVDNII